VLETANTKAPSWDASRSSTACQRPASIGGGFGVIRGFGFRFIAVSCASIALVAMPITYGGRGGVGYPNVAVK